MKTTLVFFDRISLDQRRGLGFASYQLAKKLLKAGLLDKIACLSMDSDVDIPAEKTLALYDNIFYRLVF